MDTYNFETKSLLNSPQGKQVTRILNSALNAVNPELAVKNIFKFTGNLIQVDGQTYEIDHFNNIYVIGIGKASIPMTNAVLDMIGDRVSDVVVLSKSLTGEKSLYNHQSKISNGNISIFKCGHPIPNGNNISASNKIMALLSELSENDLIILLISGGGSSLFTVPEIGITLDDLRSLTHSLLMCGAKIHEINCLRKHLSRVKGGRLAGLVFPANIISLIISDVVGDDLAVIASGPMVPDPSTFLEAYSILEKYQILEKQSTDVINYLKKGINGEVSETPKNGDPIFNKVSNFIIANNSTAALAAKKQAAVEGFYSSILTTSLQGEAREVGEILVGIARQMLHRRSYINQPLCFIVGGETTVTIRGKGTGGRNLELALSMVKGLAGFEKIMVISLATDGEDGPTNAAGAVVTGDTDSRGNLAGLDVIKFLDNNDSYNYFRRLGDLIQIGPTGTNVSDLCLMFAC